MSDQIITRRTLLAGVGAVGVGALVSACAASREQKVAEELAAALSKQDVSSLTFAETSGSDANSELTIFLANMKGATPTVTLGSFQDSGSNKTASLHWSWALDGAKQPWEYDATATLTQTGDNWLAQWSPANIHPDLARGQGMVYSTVAGTRGDILGANGEKLMTQGKVINLGLNKSKLDSESTAQNAAEQLAQLVDIDVSAYQMAVKQAGDDHFVLAITLRESDYEAIDTAKLDAITGFMTTTERRPLAITRSFAPDILGTVSPATEEDISKSNGAIAAGEYVGRGGLSERFNDLLAGSAGYTVALYTVDAEGTPSGKARKTLTELEPKAGANLTTTLNASLQQKAIDLLADQTSPSAIVALKVSTGEILAAANGAASKGYSTALLAQYAPGSTFKVATSLALLRKGDTPQSTVTCSTTATVDGRSYSNAPGYEASAIGEIPLTTAVAYSCNTAFINEHSTISQGELQDAAHALGIGMQTDLGVDAFWGVVPDAASEVEHASSLIGQGNILVSPLAMATLCASASAGQVVTPVLVRDQDLGQASFATSSTVSKAEGAQLQELMRAVVTQGHLEGLQQLSPNTAMGKTGTAEYGNEKPPRTHSWVIAAHEDTAIAVVVEDGDFGSITGGPLALGMLQAV